MNKNRIIVGIFTALVLVAGGVYGVAHVNACDGCAVHAKAEAVTDAKVEATNATKVNSGACCPSKANATTASATEANAVKVGAQCNYNAKTASAECTSAQKADAKLAGAQCTAADKAKFAENMSGETTLAKLAKCGIDVRAYETDALAAKLAGTECCGISFSKENWATMIKSAKSLEAEKANVVFANATKENPCKGDDCSFVKVAKELAAQTDNVKSTVN